MLRVIKIIIMTVVGTFLWVSPVQAHLVGQPPFFKINGVFSNLYPVPTSSIEGFNLPQDLAANNYLVNQDLNFELDSGRLPAPKEVIDQTKFIWDFGDGTQGSGLKNNHRYSKPGSYTLLIKAQYKTDPGPQIIQSVLFNVLPYADYKLPQSKILINNKSSQDPLTDILKIDLSKPIQFDGSSSLPGSAKIVSYSWDLGDTNPSNQKILTHQYNLQLNQVFPVLRVTDENGLISDQYVELEDGPESSTSPTNKPVDETNPSSKYFMNGLAIVISVALALLVFKFLRKVKIKR